MNTQHNHMKSSPHAEAAKGTHPANLGADDGVRSTHTTCGGCECVGNHSATDMPAGPGAQDWEHWEWTGGDMRLVLTMQQRQWSDNHVGYHKDVDYERGSEMVAAAYTPDDTTAGRWALVGMWVVRNPTPDSIQQFISRWLDDGIQLASSVMRTRYDYPVFFDRILLSWDDAVKAISHAIQGEGWRVDWEWDFNRGADGRVVLTNTKDESAPVLVFVDPARCQQTDAGGGTWGASATSPGASSVAVCDSPGEATEADGQRATATVGKDTGVDAGLSAGSGGIHGGSEAATTAAARRAGVGSDTVGSVENTESNGGVPTVGSRAIIDDGTNHADSVSLRGGTSGTGGESTSIPNGGRTGDKESPCRTDLRRKGNDVTSNAARYSSCGDAGISAGAPGVGVLSESACAPSQRDGAGTTRLGHADTTSAHGDGVADFGGEKAGMFTHKHTQREKSFAGEDGAGAELGFIGACPHGCHVDDLSNADTGATESGEHHNSGTCATGVSGAVRGHTPAQESNPGAPGTHGGGGSDDDSVGVSYGVPDGGFTPIVYVDYNHQEQDWFEVYGPDYTDDEGELLPEIAAAARHSIPAGGGVFPVSPGSFLQVIDVVKWWLGVDDTMSAEALGTLRRAMKGSPR